MHKDFGVDCGFYEVECPRKDCRAKIGEECKNRAYAHVMRYKAYLKNLGLDEETIKLTIRFLKQEETYPNG